MNTKRTSGWDAPAGSVDIKTILAIAFAVGGLSWGAYSMLSGGGPEKKKEPRVIASALDSNGNEVEPEYTKAKSAKQVGQIQDELAELVTDQARSTLNEIQVPKGVPDGVSDAVIHAFIPILSGDYDSFTDAILAMGGKLSDNLDKDHPIFTNLAKVFEGAKVDLTRISVSKYEAPDGRRTQMRREVNTDDVDTQPGNSSMRSSVMEMQPASLFPDAPSKSDDTAIEVSIPVQPKGETNEVIFSLILTWNPEARHWQPAAYRTIRNMLMEDEG
tara:strand:- start:386 stop:1204 length:819 start_codon:yes stop_codon:yes gene_type:complete